MNDKKKEYSISFCLNNLSLGAACIDNKGDLIKFHGKNAWTTRLISCCEDKKERRVFRATRRRLVRRRQRILNLEELFSPLINEVDPYFFIRMKESGFYYEEKNSDMKKFDILDPTIKIIPNSAYYKAKTIYHLRNDLMTKHKRYDIRLIYLAIHHIIKYRGNFLYSNTLEKDDFSGSQRLIDLFNELNSKNLNLNLVFEDAEIKRYEHLFFNQKIKKTDKIFKFKKIFESKKYDKRLLEVLNLIFGYSANLNKLFLVETLDNVKVNFSKCEDIEYIIETYPSYEEIIIKAKLVYDWLSLAEILHGETSISKAMLKKYQKFHNDLLKLKSVISATKNQDLYNKYFKNQDGCFLDEYTENICKRDSFYTHIKNDLNNYFNKDSDIEILKKVKYILKEIENNTFMMVLKSSDNVVIPYQLHLKELVKIINRQSVYYPYLKEIKSKIVSILEFKIPYYVGPIGKDNSEFKWSKRKEEGKIYPWNFEQKIDTVSAANDFVKRVVSSGKYLQDKDVMPKNSILYSYFRVLNKINKLKCNNEYLFKNNDLKLEFINVVFKKKNVVTVEDLIAFLKDHNINIDVSSLNFKRSKFDISMESYIDFEKLGLIENLDMVEELIKWITIFNDKNILKKKIENKYKLNSDIISKICNLSYRGWADISHELICNKYLSFDNTYENVINVLEKTNLSFYEIINSDYYPFKSVIENYDNDYVVDAFNYYDHVKTLYASLNSKKLIWRMLQMIEEYVKLFQYAPKNIFIEENIKNENIASNYKILEKKYKSIDTKLKKELNITKFLKILKKYENKNIKEKLFLYFIQCGKSLISKKEFDIKKLNEYEVKFLRKNDLVLDVNVSNKMLVFKEEKDININNSIIESMKQYWDNLYGANLISEKKYRKLLGYNLSDTAINSFIKRQFEFPKQYLKEISSLIKKRYNFVNVISINPNFVSNFRFKHKLFKTNLINDFSSAHDALIAGELGLFIQNRYLNCINESSETPYFDIFKDHLNKNDKYGFLISNMNCNYFDEENIILKLKKYFSYYNLIVTKDKFIRKGAFYRQMPIKKSSSSKLIAKDKLHKDTSKYGGYISPQTSYMIFLKYLSKTNTVKYSFCAINTLTKEMLKTDSNAIDKYLESKDYINPVILKNNVKINQEIEQNGYVFYLTSDNEWNNAFQLSLSNKSNKFLSYVENYDSIKVDTNEYFGISKENINEYINYFFNEYCVKVEKYFQPIDFSKVKNYVYSNNFKKLKIENKIELVKKLLDVTKANANRANLKKYGLTSDFGRLKGKKLEPKKMVFIDYSITGLLCNKTHIKL